MICSKSRFLFAATAALNGRVYCAVSSTSIISGLNRVPSRSFTSVPCFVQDGKRVSWPPCYRRGTDSRTRQMKQLESFTLHRSHTSFSSSSSSDDDGMKPLAPEQRAESLEIEATTREWLDRVVVGLNLCPFAERPIREGKLAVEVVRGNDDEVIVSQIFRMMVVQESKPGTTLVVCPECFPDNFHSFMGIYKMIEHGIMEDFHDQLSGVIQVAPFHPLFQFEGSKYDSVDNWTNRSPYPIFHILREDEVTKAVDLLQGDAGRVWKRNVELLHAMEESLGKDTVEAVLRGTADEENESRTKDILRQFKTQLGGKK